MSERAELTRQVLVLLDDSFRAHAAGDNGRARRAMDEASALDPLCVSAVLGGMRIGEVPNPDDDPQAWARYVHG